MKTFTSKICIPFVSLGIFLSFAACKHEGLPAGEKSAYDGIVKMNVEVAGLNENPGVKGVLLDTTQYNKRLGELALTDSSFVVTAFTGNTKSIDANAVKYVSVTTAAASPYSFWCTVDGSGNIKEYSWKKDESKTFFAWTNLPASGSSIVCGDAPAAGATLTHTVPTDVTAQTDILMGYYSGTGNATGTADITFYHPLTAVQFKAGNLRGVTSINSISIEGVYPGGTAVITPTSAAQTLHKDKFGWTPSTDDPITISQTVNASTFNSGDLLGEAFLLVPQDFTGNTKARIAINLTPEEGAAVNIYLPLKDKIWNAGDLYVYSIRASLNDGLFGGLELYSGSAL